MEINIGPYAGKSVEWLVLREPQYVACLLDNSDRDEAMKLLRERSQALIAQFDSKPFTNKCSGNNHGCSKPVTRCTVPLSCVDPPYWWCDDCNQYQYGGVEGRLTQLRKYRDAINHVAFFCHGREEDYRTIIRAMGTAKGLPARVGEKQAQQFFA